MADLLLTLHGDEVRSALAATCVRLCDSASVAGFSLAAAYPGDGGRGGSRGGLDDSERRALVRGLRAWIGLHGLDPFRAALEGVARRARRDLERLAEYYRSLDDEMARAIRRARADAEKARRRAKRELLPAELAARKEQLRERLRPRLTSRLLAVRVIETEIDRFAVPVQRRARAGSIAVTRRAADGRMEGPLCAACGQETSHVYLCDERLHVLCNACGHDGRLDRARCAACSPDGRAAAAAAEAMPRSITVADATASALRPGGG